MTLDTEVRINWPVPFKELLDHVTRVAGGSPDAVVRCETQVSIYNGPGQGLKTLAGVRWSESPDDDYGDYPAPPALVILDLNNPYGFGEPENTGRWVQANQILPQVVEWLDEQNVPRTAWCWQDETAGTWHPGTTPVRALWDQSIPREVLPGYGEDW